MAENTIHLFDSYHFREATPQEFGVFFTENRPKVFTDSLDIHIEGMMSDDEKTKLKSLNSLVKDRYSYRIFILKDEEIIGWHFGWQVDSEKFYMCNTGIFSEYQGKGIYTALLPRLLEIYREKGFQKVTSRHNAANNAVLVPKLKAGFMITGMEIDERFGTLVNLTYIFNEQRLKAHKYRTGELRPDDDLKKYL